MPPFDHKIQSRLIPAAESRLRGGEIVPARASLLASQIAGPGLNIISNRQFLVRLETAVNDSKQRAGCDPNRHFWDPLRHNAFSGRAIYLTSLTNKMEIKESQGTLSFDVRVAPRASRDAIEGEHAGALKIRLTAPPVDDRQRILASPSRRAFEGPPLGC
jgi:hypothetical protein